MRYIHVWPGTLAPLVLLDLADGCASHVLITIWELAIDVGAEMRFQNLRCHVFLARWTRVGQQIVVDMLHVSPR